MKIHYINILLFELPLNILIYNQRNHKSTTHHTPKIPTARLLCECDIYTSIYDNDPQMKEVMENFIKQTQPRFEEYDERMKTTRQKCKDKCDKEIQKIILKDKLEKQMEEQLTTLETKIGTDDIPTCICEKSLADKVEKGCLRCAQNLGGIVAPSSGVLGGIGEGAISVLQPLALVAAKEEALAEATSLATKAGVKAVVAELKALITKWGKGALDLSPIVNESNFNCGSALVETAQNLFGQACKVPGSTSDSSFCNSTIYIEKSEYYVGKFGKIGSDAYDATYTSKIAEFEATKVGAVNTTYAGYQTIIIASIVAIVVIVLIMVIIYKILRYRRKKKMKKKLQYIKLLEE
ncbi:hypothetical protein PFUGPA_00138 [Plasmodium falciparum Palo Alto/Uganda]|uniref:Rifin n=1 Tax=Plasmodium falciparum (isolate Palo Alto / Uganda) TaxID=57270 RepID=W4J5W8_PLAFP|nr:hypothetical protein PFUGPA_00138 [Plasmodium falciparum Palo Alto/Uganda]